MDKIQSGIKKALEGQTLYDFIASHYWEMSKEQLKDVVVELICAAHAAIENKNKCLIDGFYEDIEDELKDRGFFDD